MLSHLWVRGVKRLPRLSGDDFTLGSWTTTWSCVAVAIAGTVAATTLAQAGHERTLEILAAAAGIGWMAIRLVLMRLAASHWSLKAEAGDLRGAWALGLLPFIVGISPELRLLAWVVSAAITYVVVVRTSVSRLDARRVVGVAWGVQAVVVTANWIARNAYFIVLAMRR